MDLGSIWQQLTPTIAMTWGDIGVIAGVMFLILAWVALRVMITFGRRQSPDRIPTPTLDRRNREALESMLSLDEIAEQAAVEPAPNDLIAAVEHKPYVSLPDTASRPSGTPSDRVTPDCNGPPSQSEKPAQGNAS